LQFFSPGRRTKPSPWKKSQLDIELTKLIRHLNEAEKLWLADRLEWWMSKRDNLQRNDWRPLG